ncbi:MAG: DUF4032 domain-containing protein [Anaerolineaceae bacterium]
MTDNNPNDSFFTQAKLDFDQALAKGFWRSVISWFTQSRNTLLPFDEIRQKIKFDSQYYIGVKEIPVDKIVGSVGRYQDFDRAFLPRHEYIRSRWTSIDRAFYEDVILPPIEVYKIGEIYFVKDGNHRVSVARERGQMYIDASVIEISLPVKIDEKTNFETIILKIEQAEFLEKTKINEISPEIEIELTLPGQYQKLIEHIEVHRYFLGENKQQEISWSEAVTDWLNTVYLPLIKVIEARKLLKGFPNRTSADLYLWIIEHLWYLREEFKQEITIEEAAEHFSEMFAERPVRNLYLLFNQLSKFLFANLEEIGSSLPEPYQIHIEPDSSREKPADEDNLTDLTPGG